MPLVCILMAAYRAENTIVAAVRSVGAQTHESWELIIASDCGADYLELCRNSGIEDERLRMVTTPTAGSGPSAARNLALGAARGDFVTILDSDDTWRPERLAALLPLVEGTGLVCDNTCAMEPDGRVVATAYPPGEVPWQIDAKTMMASGMPHFPLFKRHLAGPGYRPELRFAEDVVFNMELIARAGAMTLLPQPLTHYIQRPDSATNATDAWQRAEAAYEQILGLLQGGELAVPKGQGAAIINTFRGQSFEYITFDSAFGCGFPVRRGVTRTAM